MRTAILYNFLIEANIMASIAIVLMMVLRKTMRRSLGNSCICFGWVLVAARLLLPLSFANPIIYTIRSPFASDEAIRPIAGQILVRTTDMVSMAQRAFERAGASVGVNATEQIIRSFERGVIGMRLMKVYLIGMALIAGWFIISNVHFRWKLRAGRIESISGKLLEEYQAMCRERKVKPVPVYYTDPLPSACLVGVFRPYIALPLTATPKDVINVLTHEICHLKNHDHLWALLRMACTVLHWFNPLVWIAADMSRTDTELRCDDRVVAPMDQEQKQAYANILVLAASRRNAPGVAVLATGMTMTGKRLKTRVMTVLQGAKPMRWLSITFMVVASMCLVGAFATSETMETMGLTGFAEHYIIQDIFGNRSIRNEAEALDYAKEIGALIGIDSEVTEHTAYSDLGSSKEYAMNLDYADGSTLFVDFHISGTVYEFQANRSIISWDQFVHQSIDASLIGKAQDYVAAKCDQLNPGMVKRVLEWTYISHYITDDGIIILMQGECDYDTPLSIVVQVTPDGEFHLLNMTTRGNG